MNEKNHIVEMANWMNEKIVKIVLRMCENVQHIAEME
jgi:hypothetical protein